MTEKADPQDDLQPPPQQPDDEPQNDEQLVKLKRRKDFELVVNFLIVIAFLLALLVGFGVYVYKRIAG